MKDWLLMKLSQSHKTGKGGWKERGGEKEEEKRHF